MSLEIRGSEDTIGIIIDGKLRADSFSTVQDFKTRPDQDIRKVEIIGETSSKANFQMSGHDGSFSVLEQDSAVHDVLMEMQRRNEAHEAPLPVSIVRMIKYRDGSTLTLVYEECTLAMKEFDNSGRRDLIKSSWEFFSRKVSQPGK